jgi:osmotically-inducible protein OsmY
MRTRVVVLAALLGGAGCGHGSVSEQASAAGQKAFGSLEEAYDSVRTGAQSTASYGSYVVDRASDDAVRIYREAGERARVAGQDVSDSVVTAKVKAKLAQDPEVSSTSIKVSTDAGVVKLEGRVRNRHEAARAIEVALHQEGVFAVDSRLKWT